MALSAGTSPAGFQASALSALISFGILCFIIAHKLEGLGIIEKHKVVKKDWRGYADLAYESEEIFGSMTRQFFNGRNRHIQVGAANTGNQQNEENVQTMMLGGRRYYTDIPYALPKDLTDIHRLDFLHYLFRQVFRGNYIAPLRPESVHTILDVGCGTGRWCIEMAQMFPQALVTGIDVEEV